MSLDMPGYGDAMADLDRYLVEQQARFEDELCELLRIPSVSTGRQHQAEIRQAAEWVADQLSQLGLQTELLETSGNPVVYAESPPVPGAPRCWSTATTTSSPPTRWTNGSPPRSNPPARRQSLRPRRDRRQRTDAHPRQERRGVDATRRPAARAAEVPDRR